MNKDWTGNRNSVFKTLGASNHTHKERQNEDFYATDPVATEWLLKLENIHDVVIDNSVGEGDLMFPIIKSGRKVIGFDIVNRFSQHPGFEFRNENWLDFNPDKLLNADIIFNPPYKLAQEFVEHSINLVEEGRKVCAFLKLQFLEGKKRKELFEKYPPKIVYVSSSRILCAKNADFTGMREAGGSAVAYAWFFWKKQNVYKEDYITQIKWFN